MPYIGNLIQIVFVFSVASIFVGSAIIHVVAICNAIRDRLRRNTE